MQHVSNGSLRVVTEMLTLAREVGAVARQVAATTSPSRIKCAAHNASEGQHQRGNKRLNRMCDAMGSARETRTAILLSEASGYVEAEQALPIAARIDACVAQLLVGRSLGAPSCGGQEAPSHRLVLRFASRPRPPRSSQELRRQGGEWWPSAGARHPARTPSPRPHQPRRYAAGMQLGTAPRSHNRANCSLSGQARRPFIRAILLVPAATSTRTSPE
jgi:hypothetical protein